MIQKLTFSNIVKSIGEPDQKKEFGKDYIYVYKASDEVELKFIIPKGSNTVHHISVFRPDAVHKPNKEYFLQIVGKSKELSPKAWASMLKWRKETVTLAKSNKDTLFINGPDKKRVALTFDDGPDNKSTPAIVDILKKYKVKGSFFFLGREVLKYPEVVKEAYDNGNLVLSHSFNHDDLTIFNKSELHNDIKRTEAAIEEVIGKKPAILRTPYGETDEKVIAGAHKDGYSIVLWSIDTLDWSQNDRKNIANNVLSNVRNGDIILMHSGQGNKETVEALPDIIEKLQEKGYTIVDLETLLGIKAYQ